MKFKLDENLGRRTANVIAAAGHNVSTVSDQHLNGAEDTRLFEVCASEDRCLITLDLDFTDILRFPPERGAGVAVLRAPGAASLQLLDGLVRSLLEAVQQEPLSHRLWVVEPGRIRVRG